MYLDQLRCEPYEVEGANYYTIRQFANKTNHSVQSVRNLIAHGNRIRKLRMRRVVGHPMIPEEELTQFPFTLPGRSTIIYFFGGDGKVRRYVDEQDEGWQGEDKEGVYEVQNAAL